MRLIAALSFLLILAQLSGQSNTFALIENDKGADIYYAGQEEVIKSAISIFKDDTKLVCREGSATTNRIGNRTIVVGVLGQDPEHEKLLDFYGVDASDIRNQWEAFRVEARVSEGNNILLVTGSDPRGAAYGVMELSRMIGVSPWVWWADVMPEKNSNLMFREQLVRQKPSVKYRGIFLNDEGWGLWPWAKYTFDPEFGDIGPRTYEKVFKLLLRLRANHIWPAMHPNTKSFQLVNGNREMARRYGIVVGSSHAEPLLFNNAGSEWDVTVDGPWDYQRNRKRMMEVMEKRVSDASAYENIYTMGLRGIHDSGMQGVSTPEEGAGLLGKIFGDQREILSRNINQPPDAIPQVFIPYKEVMRQYDAGLSLPDDITIMWADDNHGHIRRFSTEEEQKRTGGGGVYYHLSYLGAPHPYIWLSPVSPALIWREMSRARAEQMNRIWVANVGDLKRREWQMEFFLDLAWNETSWNEENLASFFAEVAARDISQHYAEEISSLMWEYYRLAAERKPEFMGFSESQWAGWPDVSDPHYSLWHYGDEVTKRISAYQSLRKKAAEIGSKLDKKCLDTYYQLVFYPIAAAAAMNEKWLYAYKSRAYAAQGRSVANRYSDSAFVAFAEIKELTRRYNEEVADGKWNRITDYKPGYKNGSTVFHAPVTARLETDGSEGMGVIIEGRSVPLKPTKGILPLVTTRGSVIYLNSNEATLSGEMIRAIDKDESQYLIWPGKGRDREVRTPEWDTIPYTIATDSKAVFDFYFGEPSGGLHKLYLSVDFPDHNSNSWWIKCNEQAPLPVTAAPGRYQQFQVSDVVLNNGWNRITLYPGKSGAKLYGLMLKQEGEQFMPESTTENLLPLFHSCIPATAFIDLYAFGIKPERWSATTSHPWILLSKEKGYLADGAERIFITVNANKKEIAGINEGFIDIHGEAQHYQIRVNLLHNNTIKSTGTFWEDNGVIVLPALNYTRKKESRFATWKSIRGLGRSGGAMMVTPFENDHTDSLEMGYVEAPLLEYELTVVKGGDAVVLVEAVPAYPTDKNQPMKCAISIDDGPMQEIIFKIGNESSLTWQKSLLEHRMIGKGNMHLTPGHHTFKVWGIDPSLNIDRLLINFGGLKESYNGPSPINVHICP